MVITNNSGNHGHKSGMDSIGWGGWYLGGMRYGAPYSANYTNLQAFCNAKFCLVTSLQAYLP